MSLVCVTRKATVETTSKQLEYIAKGHIAMPYSGLFFLGANFPNFTNELATRGNLFLAVI